MQHLQTLLQWLASATDHPLDKIAMQVQSGEFNEGVLTYTVRILFLDCSLDPVKTMAQVSQWLRANNREAPIKFDSDIINLQLFDLELKIEMTDKAVLTPEGDFHICPPAPTWLEDGA